MIPNKFLIEGLDRLGKSSLVESIQHKLGFLQAIHFSKPKKLTYYETQPSDSSFPVGEGEAVDWAFQYQKASFHNMFKMLSSQASLIFDRAHLGECVYSPIYRKYSGDYVYDLERIHGMGHNRDARLILLVEDFNKSQHFVDDGLSFDVTKREQEQDLFVAAFEKSCFPSKRIICVTDFNTGLFRNKADILEEALK